MPVGNRMRGCMLNPISRHISSFIRGENSPWRADVQIPTTELRPIWGDVTVCTSSWPSFRTHTRYTSKMIFSEFNRSLYQRESKDRDRKFRIAKCSKVWNVQEQSIIRRRLLDYFLLLKRNSYTVKFIMSTYIPNF